MPLGSAFAKILDKTQGIFTGMGAGAMKAKPQFAIPAAYFGATFGWDIIGNPIAEKTFGGTRATRDPYAEQIIQAKERYKGQQTALRARIEFENLQRRMQQATMRLAATDPHLYNEVLAGRSLPKDAVVFGGQPRQDLMEELAMSMATDQFKQPQSAHSELMQELGV